MVRKFVIEIMVLILLMGGSFGLLEFLFRDVRNDYDRRFDILQQRYQTITRINIGNSHIGALMNYGPDSASCINLSFGGQDIFHCYSVLKTCIPHMPELQTVVFGLDYDLLGYDYIVANERWKDRQYYPYTGELYDNSLSNIIQARSSFFRSNRDFRSLNIGQNLENHEQVFIPINNSNNETGCRQRSIVHSYYKYDSALVRSNTKLLDCLTDLCIAYNIDLIIINTPKTECYYQYYYFRTRSSALQIIDSICGMKKLKYHDYWQDSDFSSADFIDHDHLNAAGVQKLLKKLRIEKNLLPE